MKQENPQTVAHIAMPYLRATETFIYDRIRNHERFRAAVLTTEPVENLDIFPFQPVHSAATLGTAGRKADALARRARGFSPFLERAARDEGAQVLVAHFGPVGAVLVPLARRTGIPLVTMFYGHDASAAMRDPAQRRRYAVLFEAGAIVSVLSEDMKTRLAEAGCPPEKIRVHHLALDTAAVPHADPGSDGPLRIMANGRFVEKKGYPYLLDAFARVTRDMPDARMLIVGEGPGRAEVESGIARLGLGKSVRLAGRMPREEVLRNLSQSHVFALPSVTAADGDMEGTPMALIEAAAAGVPAVTTKHAGNSEVVEDGVTGFVVPERDPEALADSIMTLAGDSALRARMGSAAGEKASQEFDIHAVMRTVESDIREIIS